MFTTTESNPDPFRSHLAVLLSIYELGPPSVPIPRYDGPSDWKIERILRSLNAMAKRMHTAEESLAAIKAADAVECAAGMGKWHSNAETEDDGKELAQNSDSEPSKKPLSMTASLDDPQSSIDPSNMFYSTSMHTHCPTCGQSNLLSLSCAQRDRGAESPVSNMPSPLVVPMDSLAAAAFENDMSTLEELRLLKSQLGDVARVCNAVARGDLSQMITVPVQGAVIVQLKDVINTMVDNLRRCTREVTRLLREFGTDGVFGGQAIVLDCEGTWRELTEVANKLAANLTSQLRSIAWVTKAVTLGDLSKQIEADARGEILDLKKRVNGMVAMLRALTAEVTRVTLEVGSQGKLGGQAHVPNAEGVWFELVMNVNRTCSSLTDQVRSIAVVTTAVAQGDLTQKIQIQVEGEMLTLKGTVNSMVDQLSAFASEVTRVALEVGIQGILGGQARVEGVQGTWADLMRNVNNMATDITNQVRSVSEVAKAVALGDLGKLVNVDVRGEMLDLKMTVNSMVAQLSTLANEVTRVSLEAGAEGVLRGQAFVPDAQGMWKVLMDNVNLMAVNLTNRNQVRSIAGATKVVAGRDPTKGIEVDVQGEALEPKEA